jgi:two-component system phosphate regulon sensor histidine kinase PhoR
MVNKRLKNPIFLFYVLVVYIIIQFSWWLYLIFSLYQKTYSKPDQLEQKVWMVIGEGTVFLIILLGGAYMIRRAFKREKEVNELQENFLQSVSHELRTPISSVGLYLQTLQKRELGEEKRQDIYQRTLVEIERLNMLISDILTARNIESKNYYFDIEKIDLKSFLEAILERLKGSILNKHKINLNFENAFIEADKEALNGIIYNLVENARKYAPEKSEINFGLSNEAGKVVFTITDQGKGISSQDKTLVFDKFYRVENETTRKSKGTGLGLHITRFLVEGLKGKITLLDNKPKGLTVQIEFNESK